MKRVGLIGILLLELAGGCRGRAHIPSAEETALYAAVKALQGAAVAGTTYDGLSDRLANASSAAMIARQHARASAESVVVDEYVRAIEDYGNAKELWRQRITMPSSDQVPSGFVILPLDFLPIANRYNLQISKYPIAEGMYGRDLNAIPFSESMTAIYGSGDKHVAKADSLHLGI